MPWMSDPVRMFRLLFCGWHVVSLLLSLNPHLRFYRWFSASGLTLAKRRGLGAHPSALFGFVPAPTLTPTQLLVVGLSFIGTLLLAMTPVAPRFFLLAASVLSLLYFSSMYYEGALRGVLSHVTKSACTHRYAESTCAGHAAVLTPSILALLACAPHSAASDWPLVLIRIYVGSAYFGSGLCKVLASCIFRRVWVLGPTLQYYIFEGMWSRPAGRRVRAVQVWLLASPRLLTLCGTGALLFELGALFVGELAHARPALCVGFGLAGFAFHLGILHLMGLDFVRFWLPALFAFLVGVPAPDSALAALAAGWESEPALFVPAALITAAQLAVAFSLRDLWLDDVLPFSCCPMFLFPRSPYDEWPKYFTMTDAPLSGCKTCLGSGSGCASCAGMRGPGHLEPLYWSPCSSIIELPLAEAALLPQKVVWFGASLRVPPQARRFVKPEYAGLPFVLAANFELGPELEQLLRTVISELSCDEPGRAWDGERMRSLLALQRKARQAFDARAAVLQHVARSKSK